MQFAYCLSCARGRCSASECSANLSETRVAVVQFYRRTRRRLEQTLRQQLPGISACHRISGRDCRCSPIVFCPCLYNRIDPSTACGERTADHQRHQPPSSEQQGTPVFPIVSPPEPQKPPHYDIVDTTLVELAATNNNDDVILNTNHNIIHQQPDGSDLGETASLYGGSPLSGGRHQPTSARSARLDDPNADDANTAGDLANATTPTLSQRSARSAATTRSTASATTAHRSPAVHQASPLPGAHRRPSHQSSRQDYDESDREDEDIDRGVSTPIPIPADEEPIELNLNLTAVHIDDGNQSSDVDVDDDEDYDDGAHSSSDINHDDEPDDQLDPEQSRCFCSASMHADKDDEAAAFQPLNHQPPRTCRTPDIERPIPSTRCSSAGGHDAAATVADDDQLPTTYTQPSTPSHHIDRVQSRASDAGSLYDTGSVAPRNPNRPAPLRRKQPPQAQSLARSMGLASRRTVSTSSIVASSSSTSTVGTHRRPAPGGAAANASSTSLYPDSLTALDRPRESLLHAREQLDASASARWEDTVAGLRTLVQLLRHHPELLMGNGGAAGTPLATARSNGSTSNLAAGGGAGSLHQFAVALARHVRNLRSQVSRGACQAAAELFGCRLRSVRQQLDSAGDSDELALALLNRTADTNRFLRADAQLALDAMCDRGAAARVFAVLLGRGCTHANAVVRTAAARLCTRTVRRLGADKVMAASTAGGGLSRELRDRIVAATALLLQEGSLETRQHAKELFAVLARHASFERVLHDAIPAKVMRNIAKQLRGIQ